MHGISQQMLKMMVIIAKKKIPWPLHCTPQMSKTIEDVRHLASLTHYSLWGILLLEGVRGGKERSEVTCPQVMQLIKIKAVTVRPGFLFLPTILPSTPGSVNCGSIGQIQLDPFF